MLGWVDSPDDIVAGDCIVLIPSLGTTSQLFDLLVADIVRVRPSIGVLRVDLPGHGSGPPASQLSIAALADEVIERTSRISATGVWILGVSMGGAIALEVARRHPSKLRGFGMINGGSRFGTQDGWRELIRSVERGGTAALRSGSSSGWFSDGFATSSAALAILDSLQTIDRNSYVSCCRALAEYSGEAGLEEIASSGLLIGTDDDKATPAAGLRDLARSLPNAEYIELPRGGHLSLLENRVAVGAAVNGWLSQGRLR